MGNQRTARGHNHQPYLARSPVLRLRRDVPSRHIRGVIMEPKHERELLALIERSTVALEAIANKSNGASETKTAVTPFPWGRVPPRAHNSLREAAVRHPEEFPGKSWPWSCEDLCEMGRRFLVGPPGVRKFGYMSALEIAEVLKDLGVHPDWMST